MRLGSLFDIRTFGSIKMAVSNINSLFRHIHDVLVECGFCFVVCCSESIGKLIARVSRQP